MTADDLRTIARCHASLEPFRGNLDDDARSAHADRGVLLGLLRQVAEMDPVRVVSPCGGPRLMCIACEAEADECEVLTHRADCLWLIAQGAKP